MFDTDISKSSFSTSFYFTLDVLASSLIGAACSGRTFNFGKYMIFYKVSPL